MQLLNGVDIWSSGVHINNGAIATGISSWWIQVGCVIDGHIMRTVCFRTA